MLRRGIFLLCTIVLATAQPVAAATLYLEPNQATLGRGDAEIFAVRLDTDEAVGECVNAVSGVVQFSGPVTPIDISTGDSILSIWVERPTLDGKQVSFAGGIPNGYCGRVAGDPNLTNVLFEIVARADTQAAPDGQPVVATIDVAADTAVYLNDGFGTQASLRTLPSTLRIEANPSDEVQNPWSDEIEQDTNPPQEFSIQLSRDERAFQGEYFISFSTTDKETGIDRYEVIEEPIRDAGTFSWGRADAPWVTVTATTYQLDDQSLNSIIRVKAIDKAGNEYIASLIPDEELRSLSADQLFTYVLLATLGVILVVGTVVGWRWYQLRRREQELAELEAAASEIDPFNTPNQTPYDK